MPRGHVGDGAGMGMSGGAAVLGPKGGVGNTPSAGSADPFDSVGRPAVYCQAPGGLLGGCSRTVATLRNYGNAVARLCVGVVQAPVYVFVNGRSCMHCTDIVQALVYAFVNGRSSMHCTDIVQALVYAFTH